MKRVLISSDALSDLNKGFLFYERQAVGLGDYFSSGLRSDIEELKVTGGSHRLIFRSFRRSLSRVFPFGIFYTAEDVAITVWAVIDLRQDPEFIHRQLNQIKTERDD